MLTQQLFSALHLTRDEETGFGEFRSFPIDQKLIKETKFTYTRVDSNGIYQDCPVYQITKHIKLSTRWSGGGRPFLYGDKKIDLPIGSYIYVFPPGHPIYSLDSWTRFNVTVEE